MCARSRGDLHPRTFESAMIFIEQIYEKCRAGQAWEGNWTRQEANNAGIRPEVHIDTIGRPLARNTEVGCFG
jgi:hypothetical protein